MASPYFTQATFRFLAALEKNNRREWFDAHRQDYEDAVRTPALNFIGDIAGDLALISPHFLALPRKVGGALMRVHRDTRFGSDKRPYKTNVGIQFRHEAGKDVHAPGYYLHLEPEGCFLAVGIWRPDADALWKIRTAIAEKGEAWLAARDAREFRRCFDLSGDALSRAPRGFARDHPLLDDLRRKDLIGMAGVSDAMAVSGKFYDTAVKHYAAASPFMRFLCGALALRF